MDMGKELLARHRPQGFEGSTLANTSSCRDLPSLGKEFDWKMSWDWAVQGSAPPVHEFIFWEAASRHVCVIKDVLGIP